MATVVPLVVIVGETASGKTALGIDLARQFNGEIICADSRTIYRGMDTGTAKPTLEEQAGIRHHLLDIRDPNQRYSAADFKADALAAIEDITDRGKLPIMVGGSGLYIDAVIFNYQFLQTKRKVDNPRHSTTEPVARQLRPHTLVLGLRLDREELEKRVNQRFNAMMQAGLLDEAKTLLAMYGPDNEALRSAGYYALQNGPEGQQNFKRVSMLLAKKQRTWFRRNKSIHWLNNRGDAVAITTTFLNNLPV